jgi:carbamate kinase
LDYHSPSLWGIDYMSVEEAMDHLREGQFPEGSMRPKIEAAIEFLKMGGERVIITSLDRVQAAIDGEAGTHMSYV